MANPDTTPNAAAQHGKTHITEEETYSADEDGWTLDTTEDSFNGNKKLERTAVLYYTAIHTQSIKILVNTGPLELSSRRQTITIQQQ